MQVDDIRRLVKLVEESDIDELEVRRWWEVLRITKRARVRPGEAARTAAPEASPTAAEPAAGARVTAPAAAAPAVVPAPAVPREAEAAKAASGPAAGSGEGVAGDGLIEIRSPMVGTFYRAPNPTAAPFVDTGSHVVARQVICIVEAMKLMNEIEAEQGGTIERILAENGKPVEYNQPLFLVRPD